MGREKALAGGPRLKTVLSQKLWSKVTAPEESGGGKSSSECGLEIQLVSDQRARFFSFINRHELVGGLAVEPFWNTQDNELWLGYSCDSSVCFERIDLASGKRRELFDAQVLQAALLEQSGSERRSDGLKLDGFVWSTDGCVRFSYAKGLWTFDPRTHALTRERTVDSFSGSFGWASSDAQQPRTWQRYDYISLNMQVPEQLSPTGEWYASINDHNVELRPAVAGRSGCRKITDDGSPAETWDIEGRRWVSLPGKRVAFRDVNPWSPDGLSLFAIKRNLSAVYRAPRVNWLDPVEYVDFVPQHKAGMPIDRLWPVIINVRSGEKAALDLGEVEDRYLQFLGWTEEGNHAYLIDYSRDFKTVIVRLADRQTGQTTVLLTETSDAFVKVQHDAIFSGVHGFYQLPGDAGFLWLSTRSGWNHIYHYSQDGILLKQCTSGNWPVHQIVKTSAETIFFTASPDIDRPYDVHVCSVALEGGPVCRLSNEIGVHEPVFSPDGSAYLDTHSSVDRPPRVDLVTGSGTVLATLSQMDISQLVAVGFTPAEEFAAKAADSETDIWGVVYRPPNFDPSKSYPVIEYIYGGPQSYDAPHFFAVDAAMMSTVRIPWALTQLGYVVVCMDGRGTPGRSKAFHDAVYQNLAGGIEDHAVVMDQLCERNPWMDRKRIGIWGHSWGGYFATCGLIFAPHIYRAAVASAPSYDPGEAIYYEPYLGAFDRYPDVYRATDLTRLASKIQAPLMIVAGTNDFQVLPSAIKMAHALIHAGVEHEFVLIPNAFHQYEGKEEEYFLNKMTGWFARHLGEQK